MPSPRMRMSFAFAGFCMSLKNMRPRVEDLGRDGVAAAATELVPRAGRGSSTNCTRNGGPAP